MKLKVIEGFTWAHRGIDVEQFAEGAEIDTDDGDLIDVSTREGWCSMEGAPENKAHKSPKSK